MLALSGNNIILHPHAVLGPIDPQINGIPAQAIRGSFEDAKDKIAREGPRMLPAYLPLIEKYTLHLLKICNDAENLSKKLVSEWLRKYMFNDKNDDANVKELIENAVKYLSNYEEHLTHSRPLSAKKLSKLNLKIEIANAELQELLWEAYILINGFFTIAPIIKIYESVDVATGVVSQMIEKQQVYQKNKNPKSDNRSDKQ